MSELIQGDDNQTGGKSWASNSVATTAPNLQQRCLAKVDAEIESLETWIQGFQGFRVLNNERRELLFLRALRSVIVRHEFVSYNPNPDQSEKYFKSGYNQALKDIRADIAKELGVDE